MRVSPSYEIMRVSLLQQQLNMNYGWYRDDEKGFWYFLWLLIGHLIGTSLVFVLFYSLVWSAWYIFGHLNAIYPFPSDVYDIVLKVEKFFIYCDVFGCAIMLVVGILRFCRDLLDNNR